TRSYRVAWTMFGRPTSNSPSQHRGAPLAPAMKEIRVTNRTDEAAIWQGQSPEDFDRWLRGVAAAGDALGLTGTPKHIGREGVLRGTQTITLGASVGLARPTLASDKLRVNKWYEEFGEV